jgi:hypothetical protein
VLRQRSQAPLGQLVHLGNRLLGRLVHAEVTACLEALAQLAHVAAMGRLDPPAAQGLAAATVQPVQLAAPERHRP